MNKLLIALSLMAGFALMAITPSPTFTGQVSLRWGVDGPLNPTNRFIIIGSPTLTIPTTNWPVLATTPGNVTNAIVMINPANQSFFFVCAESNRFGIGPFSNVADMILPRPATLEVQGAQ